MKPTPAEVPRMPMADPRSAAVDPAACAQSDTTACNNAPRTVMVQSPAL
jgi:hypothetical protein